MIPLEYERQFWAKFFDRLAALERGLPSEQPTELPPEQEKGFWVKAATLESERRDEVSDWLRCWLAGRPAPISHLDAWLVRRRAEWAGQLAIRCAEKRALPALSLDEFVSHALIESWETDGCVGLINHASRV